MADLIINSGLIAFVVVAWLGWMVVVGVLWRKRLFRFELLSKRALVCSTILTPLQLAICRAVIAAWAIFIWIWSLVVEHHGDPIMFCFYTVWNYSMLLIFFAGSSVLGFCYQFRLLNATPSRGRLCFERTIWVFFQICCTMVFLVDICVWTILLPQYKKDGNEAAIVNFSSFNVHGVNFALIAFDFCINALPVVPAHSLFLLAWAFSYMLFSWAYFAGSGRWMYYFLDTDKPTAALWYAGLLLAHLLFFLLVFGLTLLKDRLLRFKGRTLKLNQREEDEEDQEALDEGAERQRLL